MPSLQHVPLAATIPSEHQKQRSHVDKIASLGVPGQGVLPPIVVRAGKRRSSGKPVYQVIDGHHRRLAAIRRGDETIAAWVIKTKLEPMELWCKGKVDILLEKVGESGQ